VSGTHQLAPSLVLRKVCLKHSPTEHSMSATIPSAELFDRFISDSESAFGHCYFKSAYHALAGAMHCAEQEGDALRLRTIMGLVRSQQRGIEAASFTRPAHEVAGMGGPKGFYETLQRQLAATIRLVELRNSLGPRTRLNLL
jgi:hypothetical protein